MFSSRKREGTQIFAGVKPDVIRVVEAPSISSTLEQSGADFSDRIDERTNTVAILAETTLGLYSYLSGFDIPLKLFHDIIDT